MSAEKYRKLADQLVGEYGQATLWVREEAAALLRSLADALEKGPEPVGWLCHSITVGKDGEPSGYGVPQLLHQKPSQKQSSGYSSKPLYDSTAILAAEMRGAERMRERIVSMFEYNVETSRGESFNIGQDIRERLAEEEGRALGAGEKG